MKKYLFMLLVVIAFVTFAAFTEAQEHVTVQFEGEKTIAFDPSPDERVIGYILYFDDGEVERNSDKSSENTSGNWLTPTSFRLEEGRLHPGKTYTITATAYDADSNESPRSEPLVVTVEANVLPEENMMPLFQPVVAPTTPNIQGAI